jgi:tetratricopeptide (TPR) repeat protein
LLLLLLLFLVADSPTQLLQRGLLALQSGDLIQARSALEQAAKAEPRNAYAWVSLAETYARLNEPVAASEAAAKAEKFGAGNATIERALAMYYSKRALPMAEKDAEKHLAAAWEGQKTDPRLAFDYSEVLLRKQDFGTAAEVISRALAAHPNDAQLVLTLGVARYGQRRFDDAIAAFLQVIRIDPQIEQPYLFLGKMLDQAGERLAAITRAYEKWLVRNPRNPAALLLLAKARLAADPKDATAEALLRKSIGVEEHNWQAHYELGVLLEGKRDWRGAAAELQRSAELNASQAMPHYHLARVYERLGDAEKAQAERALHETLAK